MKYALAMILTVALIRAGMAAPESAPSADLGQNAALRYWTAFALMSAPTPEQDKIIGNWKTAAMDDKTVQLIQANSNALDYLQLAAAVKPCDWGIVPAGPETLLPHLAKARQLARLACLRARYRFSRGESVDGVRDVCAVLTMASQVDSGELRTLISMLVKCAIQNAAIEAVSDRLPALDAAALKGLANQLDALPRPDFAESMRSERKDFVGWFLQTLRGGDLAATQKLLDMLRDPASKVPADVLPAGNATPEIAQQITRQLEEFDASIGRLVDAAGLPPSEFEGRTASEAKKLTEARNPFGILMGTAWCYARARSTSAKAEALMLMLRTATAIALEGPESLKNFKDPYGSGPFEYRALPSGFELKSALLCDGKPVTLTVGAR